MACNMEQEVKRLKRIMSNRSIQYAKDRATLNRRISMHSDRNVMLRRDLRDLKAEYKECEKQRDAYIEVVNDLEDMLGTIRPGTFTRVKSSADYFPPKHGRLYDKFDSDPTELL